MIKIQNKHLRNVTEFLYNTVTAKGKKNVHRMRIVKALEKRNKEVSEERLTLIEEYCGIDENGEPKRKENGDLDIDDVKGFNREYDALYDEYFIIDDKNLEPALKTVEKLVNNFDKELSGNDAEAHFVLIEAFEEAKEESAEDTTDENEEEEE